MRSCRLAVQGINSLPLIKPDGLLPCSPEPLCGPHREPDESIPHNPTLL
jgi:hypothetical protein